MARLLALSALVGGWMVGGCTSEIPTETDGGTGGASSRGGAPVSTAGSGGAALCGGQVCASGMVCCGPPECGHCIPEMSGQACPATCGTGGQGAGGAGGSGGLCGSQVCPSGQVCCGPPQCGICVPAGSDIACPTICVATGGSGAGGAATGKGGTPNGGAGSTCAPQQGSCANGETCCSGLTCCSGMPVAPGHEYCGTVCPVSDRNLKTAIEPVNQDAVLERLMTLPVSTWSYRSEGTGVRHLGPMAQDFQAAFGLGASDRTILQVDGDGVALAALQALTRKFEKLSAENAELRRRLGQLEEQTAACGLWKEPPPHRSVDLPER